MLRSVALLCSVLTFFTVWVSSPIGPVMRALWSWRNALPTPLPWYLGSTPKVARYIQFREQCGDTVSCCASIPGNMVPTRNFANEKGMVMRIRPYMPIMSPLRLARAPSWCQKVICAEQSTADT